ncbi:MAG: 30S ribosomal protein S6 [Acidobacteria bacterium]|nr:30S ribosomal protein S6 [Acidobacteriota bacterium]
MNDRKYELVYVMKPEATEAEVAEMQAQVEAIIARLGGALEKTDVWGRRKLAYDIGNHKEGFYVLHVIAGSGELMKEIDRRLRNTEGLLRHLVVRIDESDRKAERSKTIRVEDSRRRRVARGLPPDRQPGEGPQQADGDDDDRDGYESPEA